MIKRVSSSRPGRCTVSSWYLVRTRSRSMVDLPSTARAERRAQLFPADGVRASIRALVAEAQARTGFHQRRRRRQTRHVPGRSSPSRCGTAAVQHRLKHAPQTLQRNASAAANSASIPRSPAFCRAIASAVSATSTRRPAIPARRGEARSRRSRSPRRARLPRIRPRRPNALSRAAARRRPTAQGRRGTTHPRAVQSSVRDCRRSTENGSDIIGAPPSSAPSKHRTPLPSVSGSPRRNRRE